MDCSRPGHPVLHYLLEFAQTHVHWIHDAIISSLENIFIHKYSRGCMVSPFSQCVHTHTHTHTHILFILTSNACILSHSVMSNSLQPYGLQHARLPCTSLSPGVCSNSCPLSWWCHSTILSCVALFSCPQSFPAYQGLFQWVSSNNSLLDI